MGLLDDAIREHLELKRRRGADPAEIERDEQEALGPPVRRAPEEDDQAPLEAAQHDDEGDYGSEEDDEQWDDDPFAEESEAFADEPEPFDSGRHASAEETSPFDDEDDEDDPFRDEPRGRSGPAPTSDPDARTQIFNQEGDEPPAPPPRAGSPPSTRGRVSDETAEFDVASEDVEHEDPPAARHEDEQATDEHTAEKQKGDEDVLEETPEFLQDTPDHDRLWFEQRPPRDFDFDG